MKSKFIPEDKHWSGWVTQLDIMPDIEPYHTYERVEDQFGVRYKIVRKLTRDQLRKILSNEPIK